MMKKSVDNFLIGRANNFDFVRFCAALAVIFSHSFVLSKPSEFVEPLKYFSHGRFNFGEVAVAVFFIISGLLISQSFDRSKNILSFIQARVLRIYPALIVTILLTVIIVGPIFTTQSLKHYFISSVTLKYLLNIFCVRINFMLPGLFKNNFFPNAVNGSLWTLPQELGCYGLVLAAGLFFEKKYTTAIIASILVLSIFFGSILFNVHTFYFAIGALIYIYREKIIVDWRVALLALIILLFNFHYDKYLVLLNTISGICLAYLVLFLSFTGTDIFKNFSKPGDFSYGIYIWGFVVEQVVALKIPQLNPYTHFLLSACITFMLAVMSWHFIENPALALKKRLKSNPYLLLPENSVLRRISFLKKK